MSDEIIEIPREKVRSIEPLLIPLIAPALNLTPKIDPRSLMRELELGNAQAWLVYTDGELCAAVITELCTFPTGRRTARVDLLAGRLVKHWRAHLCKIEAWARSQGCDAIEVAGRRGWLRLLPDYHHIETTIAKEL